MEKPKPKQSTRNAKKTTTPDDAAPKTIEIVPEVAKEEYEEISVCKGPYDFVSRRTCRGMYVAILTLLRIALIAFTSLLLFDPLYNMEVGARCERKAVMLSNTVQESVLSLMYVLVLMLTIAYDLAMISNENECKDQDRSTVLVWTLETAVALAVMVFGIVSALLLNTSPVACDLSARSTIVCGICIGLAIPWLIAAVRFGRYIYQNNRSYFSLYKKQVVVKTKNS